MLPIECDVKKARFEIDQLIAIEPTVSVQKLWDRKRIELSLKYNVQLAASFIPDFNSIDSAFFCKKAKLVPKLPKSIDELDELPEIYSTTKRDTTFLASQTYHFSTYINFASLIMLNILANSDNWFCDGTFKSAPAHYYQHYIIQADYKHWPLPGCYSFLSGKSTEIYKQMINELKEAAMSAGLVLAPKLIRVDFEQAFKFHFPSAKISGCHFHFSSSIYKKLCEIGLKTLYSSNNQFKQWTRMIMSMPFLKIDDLEDAWLELKDEDFDLINEKIKIDSFINYLEATWLGENPLFPSNIWNLLNNMLNRTTNVCETYNKKMNCAISKPSPNIYRLIEILKYFEQLAAIDFEKANQGQKKNRRTKEDLKILINKLKY